MNNRTETKLTDLSGMRKAIEEILKQAWERGRKYGQNEERPQGEFSIKELEGWLTAQGFSSGTVEDKVKEFKRYIERSREDE